LGFSEITIALSKKIQSFTTEDAKGYAVISNKEDLEQLTVYVYCLKN